MRFIKTGLIIASLTALGACGDTFGEQAVLGAGAGTAGALVTNGDPVTGAVVGAAANVAYCRQYPSRC
jgi:hypothetical protein